MSIVMSIFLKRLREPDYIQTGNIESGAQSSDTLVRIENIQAYLLQVQESQSVVAQQMSQVSAQFTQIMQNASIGGAGYLKFRLSFKLLAMKKKRLICKFLFSRF